MQISSGYGRHSGRLHRPTEGYTRGFYCTAEAMLYAAETLYWEGHRSTQEIADMPHISTALVQIM